MTTDDDACKDRHPQVLERRIAVLEERIKGRDEALRIAQLQYPTQRDFIDLKEQVDRKIVENTWWVKLLASGAAFASIITTILTFRAAP